ncbi:MAG: nodulation protein NfeD [Gammaproteobacteria bacterium]|nr:nodulation protein NfeD [Gammaproteobacteria bacterium]MCI0591703.1 nodulation protein NfeD [Gammaproteobacteria bacterium]
MARAGLAISLSAALAWQVFAGAERYATILTIDDAIGPATGDYVHRGLEQAREGGAELVIIRVDTPGGLDTAMRDMIRDIIASPIPVVVYVAPSGARAASAGTYLLYAAHIAAMAPGTNLGAATPIQLGGVPDISPPEGAGEKEKDKDQGAADDSDSAMQKKIVNDAVAYIRSLAEMRHRNAEWAEQAVREAASLPAKEALSQGVIDIMAGDVSELLSELDGREVNVLGRDIKLSTQGLITQAIDPDWRSRLLAVITNPNVAYILMLLGVYGLIFELANPGAVLPGVMGAICLLLALYALQVLPVNYAGLALIILGIVFMISEMFVSSFGVLGIGGVIAFVIGSVILFDTDGGQLAISVPLIGTLALVSAGFFMVIMGMALKVHRRPVVSGMEEMVGIQGEVLEDFNGSGRVRAHGESWQARSDSPLRRGQRVRITRLEGLTLVVEPINKEH